LIEDKVLVERVLGGDKTAYRELVERSRKMVYYLALDMTGNREDAEDISQDVFIKAFRSLHNFRGDSKFSTWIYRITLNTCLSQKRKKINQVTQTEENMEEIRNKSVATVKPSFFDNPEKVTEAGFIQKNIEKALFKLSGREKSVFVLRNYKELSFEEISEILELKAGTVRSLNFRALQKLRKELSFYKNDFRLEENNA